MTTSSFGRADLGKRLAQARCDLPKPMAPWPGGVPGRTDGLRDRHGGARFISRWDMPRRRSCALRQQVPPDAARSLDETRRSAPVAVMQAAPLIETNARFCSMVPHAFECRARGAERRSNTDAGGASRCSHDDPRVRGWASTARRRMAQDALRRLAGSPTAACGGVVSPGRLARREPEARWRASLAKM